LKILNHKSQIASAVLLAAAVLTAGCASNSRTEPSENYRYRNPDKNLAEIGRVAFVELNNKTTYPEIPADISEELFESMQKKQIFGLNLVRQNDTSWRSLQLDADSEYTLEEIQRIRVKLKCDGLLVGTITRFSSYPHTAVGLRMKMLDLRDGQLAWAIEQVWDSSDKTVEQRIKNYLRQQKRSDSSAVQEQLVKMSPLEFFKFVSSEVANTLEKK
jgi:hypothetical protein